MRYRLRPSPRIALVAVATATLLTTALVPVAASAAPTAVDPSVQRAPAAPAAPVAWAPCPVEDPEFPPPETAECATVAVPLDYDRPRRATLDVALARIPATSPEKRIGSLFINPGGPGGSGIDVVLGLGPFLPEGLRAQFDIVGFDPRGVARSTPLRCFRTFEESLTAFAPIAYPETPPEEDLWIAADRRLEQACDERAGAVRDHMSTGDVARDMDLLRGAVGDRKLTYLGLSYGSILGQTYANLFPDRVRALAIDGVLDPREWAGRGRAARTVPTGTRLGSADGSQATLGEFFRTCDAAGPDCAFSGDSAARFADLGARLKAEPLEITDEFGTFLFTYNDLIGFTLSALYAPVIWPDLALLLADLEAGVSAQEIGAGLATLRTKLGIARAEEPQEEYPNFVESFPGVFCADTRNPRDYRYYRRAADAAEERSGYFGRLWNWQGSVCAEWDRSAQQDRYAGPWRTRTSNPVLVVGNSFDPATPYEGALAANRLLRNSALLTYTGWGHTAFMTGSACVDAAVTAYLVTSIAHDQVCDDRPDPFGLVAASAAPVTGVVAANLPPGVREALR
jgi:pimeloyl-ACP methyl ester carboxylesterase